MVNMGRGISPKIRPSRDYNTMDTYSDGVINAVGDLYRKFPENAVVSALYNAGVGLGDAGVRLDAFNYGLIKARASATLKVPPENIDTALHGLAQTLDGTPEDKQIASAVNLLLSEKTSDIDKGRGVDIIPENRSRTIKEILGPTNQAKSRRVAQNIIIAEKINAEKRATVGRGNSFRKRHQQKPLHVSAEGSVECGNEIVKAAISVANQSTDGAKTLQQMRAAALDLSGNKKATMLDVVEKMAEARGSGITNTAQCLVKALKRRKELQPEDKDLSLLMGAISNEKLTYKER